MMTKKRIVMICALLAVGVSATVAATACEKHNIIDVEEVPATCISQGRIAHQECTTHLEYYIDGKEVNESDLIIPVDPDAHKLVHYTGYAATCTEEGQYDYDKCDYCGKIFIDGVEVYEDSTVIPVDPDAHGDNISYMQEVAADCGHTGMKAHYECSECGALLKLVDGEYVRLTEEEQADLVIPMTTEHTWDGNYCTICDAYKVTVNGVSYIIDTNNRYNFNTTDMTITYGAGSEEKAEHIADHFANPLTFGTQIGSSNTAVSNGSTYTVSTTNTTLNSFTRFAFPTADGTALYTGRLIMAFDFAYTGTVDNNVLRLGVKVVNDTATLINTDAQSLLLGSTEGSSYGYTFSPDTTYRFIYVIDLTDTAQLIQIFTNINGGASSVTLSNLHFAYVEGLPAETAKATLAYFGNPETCAVDNFNLALKTLTYVEAVDSTCNTLGHAEYWVDSLGMIYSDQYGFNTATLANLTYTTYGEHNLTRYDALTDATCAERTHPEYWYCDVCEKYFVEENGEKVEKDYDTIMNGAYGAHQLVKVDAKASTCEEAGNTEYWYCTVCNKYFSDAEGTQETTLAAVTLPLAAHSLTYTEATATCHTLGNRDYYRCSVCGKYFADAEATQELTEEEVFNVYLDHDFNEYGKCRNEGCYAIEIKVADPDTAFGTSGTINEALKANPGTWVCQVSSGGGSASIEDGVITAYIPQAATANNKKAFLRYKPGDAEGNSYIGTYLWTFDFVVVKDHNNNTSGTVNLGVGFFIQVGNGDTVKVDGVDVSVADVYMDFEIGKVYHFEVLVEITSADYYSQFNVRNGAGYGATVQFSNAQMICYSSDVNTGVDSLRALYSLTNR